MWLAFLIFFSNPEKKGNEVSVAAFNTLRRGYHFNGNTWVTEEQKAWPHRLNLLEKLLGDMDADIMCLQEIEHETMEEDFHFLLKSYAKRSAGQKKKGHSFCKPTVFWKEDMFELTWQSSRSRAIIVELKRKEDGAMFLVANVHLQGGNQGQEDRKNQLRNIVQIITQRAASADVLVVAGDFNANVKGPELDVLRDEGFTGLFASRIPFSHAWGSERGNFFRTTIDEIFVAGAAKPVMLRSPLTAERYALLSAEGAALPDAEHPSDHLPLACCLSLTEK